MILSAISDRLGLSSVHTTSAYSVLRRYGNMSSATLIFVLRELLDQFERGQTEPAALPQRCSPFVPALAFGPGLNVEGCLLKWIAPKDKFVEEDDEE
jgi:predicted naringenin-chalcone synthase